MAPGVTVEISKAQKDELYVNGNDIENVSKSAARIQQSTVKKQGYQKILGRTLRLEKDNHCYP